MTTIADVTRVARGLTALSNTARLKLNADLQSMASLCDGTVAEQALYLSTAQELFIQYGIQYGQAAQALALEILDSQGILLVDIPNIGQTFYPNRIITKAIEDVIATYLDKAMDNVVKRGYRETITANSDRWARVPTGSYTCPWCVMLASRGFVYKTQERAMAAWHPYCDCVIWPAKDENKAYVDGYDPDMLYNLYKQGKGIGEKPDGKTALDTSGNDI